MHYIFIKFINKDKDIVFIKYINYNRYGLRTYFKINKARYTCTCYKIREQRRKQINKPMQ